MGVALLGLGVLTALAEEPGLIPRALWGSSQLPKTPVQGILHPLLASEGTCAYVHQHTHLNRHLYKQIYPHLTHLLHAKWFHPRPWGLSLALQSCQSREKQAGPQ